MDKSFTAEAVCQDGYKYVEDVFQEEWTECRNKLVKLCRHKVRISQKVGRLWDTPGTQEKVTAGSANVDYITRHKAHPQVQLVFELVISF